jgi:hypothetical protein
LSHQPSPSELVIKRHQDYLVANLLDFFRTIDNENKWMNAVKIALNQIERTRNAPVDKLEKKFSFLANRLKNNISPSSIRDFACECVLAAVKNGMLKAEQKSDPLVLPKKSLDKKVQRDLFQALGSGCSESSAINRAANNLWQEKLEHQRAEQRTKMIDHHPLKDTLSTLGTGQKPLAREDIRNHLLRLKKTPSQKGGGMLFNVLKKAQSFSALRLHQLLGDELFFLCRPLGFLDQKDETVIVEVPSNAHMHALTYRKLEILRALKNDPCFEKTKTIRFKISGALF